MRPVFADSELLAGKHRGITYQRENRTEAYVSVPPALIITDSNGATWTLGTDYISKGATYYWGIHRNDAHTGEHASILQYQRGRLWAWTPEGQKIWRELSPREQMFSRHPGYWV